MAKVKSIRVGFGISQAKGPNNWLKANAEMEVEFTDPEDNNMKEDIWENAWNRVTDECAKQLKRFDNEQ
jgi:hypothetical protein